VDVRRSVAVATIVVVALMLSGCAAFGRAAAPEGEVPVAQLRVPAEPAGLLYFHQIPDWTDCTIEGGDHDECTRIAAPLDWRDPFAGSVRIALVRHRATGPRLGSVVVDPGGPGGSGVDLVTGDVTQAVTPAVAKRYDVVGIDPRGVGASSAVDCGGTKALDDLLYGRLPGTIGSAAWVKADLARSKAFAAACRRHSGKLLDHIDTVSAAHDLELVRSLLGDPKLNYIGYSYGSYLGTVYAGLYPQHVGRFVFDGIDDPWEGEDDSSGSEDSGDSSDSGDGADDAGSADDQAGGFDGALDAYLVACLAGKKDATGGTHPCPFTGTLTEAQDAVRAVLAAAASDPLPADDGRELTDQTLATGIIEAMYDAGEWPELSTMFRQLKRDDPTTAFRLADEYNSRGDDGYGDNSSVALLAIQCLESGSGYDLKGDRSELRDLTREAPILGPYFAYGDLGCAGWQKDPAPWPEPIHAKGAGPILLVGTTDDPATPYSSALALRDQLADAHLVTYHGEGHTAYDLGHRCVDRAVERYLIHGTVPRHDPQCR
jgi:pimeloyl-ACP methyl ester carboxylesterase